MIKPAIRSFGQAGRTHQFRLLAFPANSSSLAEIFPLAFGSVDLPTVTMPVEQAVFLYVHEVVLALLSVQVCDTFFVELLPAAGIQVEVLACDWRCRPDEMECGQ